jgi:hypothetical protein
MRLHCAFPIYDDLHDFAERWLATGNVYSHSACDVGNANVMCLYRDDVYQVELCFVKPDTVIPAHTHPDADTIEVGVFGGVRLFVNDVDPFAEFDDEKLAKFTRMRGLRINSSDVHGGKVSPMGAAFLSIQRWKHGPKSVLTDYVGQPMSAIHEAMK